MDGQMAESVDRWTESLLGLTGRARHRLFPPLPPWSLGPYILLMSPSSILVFQYWALLCSCGHVGLTSLTSETPGPLPQLPVQRPAPPIQACSASHLQTPSPWGHPCARCSGQTTAPSWLFWSTAGSCICPVTDVGFGAQEGWPGTCLLLPQACQARALDALPGSLGVREVFPTMAAEPTWTWLDDLLPHLGQLSSLYPGPFLSSMGPSLQI